jgi:phosphoserine phosphatase
VELALVGAVEDITAVRKDVLAISQASDIDIAIQEDDIYRRHRRLVVFDMDSTLIKCEVIDELARAAGTVDEVAKITAAAMRGEIPCDESFRTRLGT